MASEHIQPLLETFSGRSGLALEWVTSGLLPKPIKWVTSAGPKPNLFVSHDATMLSDDDEHAGDGGADRGSGGDIDDEDGYDEGDDGDGDDSDDGDGDGDDVGGTGAEDDDHVDDWWW